MTNLSLDWWIEEYMIFCRSRQLRGKTLDSYEQGLRLFERWCKDTLNIDTVDKISEGVIRRYINEIHERGKYTFYAISLLFLVWYSPLLAFSLSALYIFLYPSISVCTYEYPLM